MYVCLCNPFTDKDVANVLRDASVRKTTAHVYKACAGGEKPCCGSCLCVIKDMVAHHQNQPDMLAAE
jgi:bacterioferritin-associated ferredoxin